MRKFKDMKTGATLETKSEFVAEQYAKYKDRYSPAYPGLILVFSAGC